MDPDAAVERLNNAIADRDWEEATYALSDLSEWLMRGGFWPAMTIGPDEEHLQSWLDAEERGEPGGLDPETYRNILAMNLRIEKERAAVDEGSERASRILLAEGARPIREAAREERRRISVRSKLRER